MSTKNNIHYLQYGPVVSTATVKFYHSDLSSFGLPTSFKGSIGVDGLDLRLKLLTHLCLLRRMDFEI